MKNIFSKKFLLALVFSLALVSLPYLVSAAGILPAESGGATCPEGQAGRCGNYTLNDAVQLAVNVANWILGIVGSLALLMFVLGGVMFLVSGGNTQTVDRGKKILIGSAIGMVIVFGSYMIIQFSMSALGLQWSGTTATPTPTTPVTVVEPCTDQFGSQGFSCMLETNGQNCKTGFCSGGTEIKCCQPK
jgi:hypothetical protein